MGFPKYDMEYELRRFRPLVTATARRYAGRGADFDDLVQEGYLALLELVPRCGDPERLPLFLKNRLPARVRAAARREWRQQHVLLENMEGTPEEPAIFEEPHIPDRTVEECLCGEDRELVILLAGGFSQKEAAERFGITQQAVSARLRMVRKRLAPLIQ